MTQDSLRVVKLGGSLLDFPDLADRLRRWLLVEPAFHSVFIAGGGRLVEHVRQWHAAQAINDQAAHWMCIDLMTVTAHLLHARLPEIWLEEDDGQLCRRVGSSGATIFGPARWLRHSEPRLPGYRLPACWGTTSDSIAARLTAALGARELVLLKSASPPDGMEDDLSALAQCGYVDKILPRLEPELMSWRCVNLREM